MAFGEMDASAVYSNIVKSVVCFSPGMQSYKKKPKTLWYKAKSYFNFCMFCASFYNCKNINCALQNLYESIN